MAITFTPMTARERRRLFLERNHDRDRKRRWRAMLKEGLAAHAMAVAQRQALALPAVPERLALPAPAELPWLILPDQRELVPVLVESQAPPPTCTCLIQATRTATSPVTAAAGRRGWRVPERPGGKGPRAFPALG